MFPSAVLLSLVMAKAEDTACLAEDTACLAEDTACLAEDTACLADAHSLLQIQGMRGQALIARGGSGLDSTGWDYGCSTESRFHRGDNVAGSEVQIADWKNHVSECAQNAKTDARCRGATGVTIGAPGTGGRHRCYCEFGGRNVNINAVAWQTCSFPGFTACTCSHGQTRQEHHGGECLWDIHLKENFPAHYFQSLTYLVGGMSACWFCDEGYVKKYDTVDTKDPLWYGHPVSSWTSWWHYYASEWQESTCQLKQCTCDHGRAASGTECPSNGAEHCLPGTCERGYHAEYPWRRYMVCRQNECTCANGVAVVGTDCGIDNQHKCATCHEDRGYALDTRTNHCRPRQCNCDGGTGATGLQCPGEGQDKCIDCQKDDAHIVKKGEDGTDKCLDKECTCANGEGAVGAACPEDGDAKCATCFTDNGYVKEGEVCICDDARGYFSKGGKCQQKQCSCGDHGEDAVGTACPTHAAPVCAKCTSPGYVLQAGKCECTATGYVEASGDCACAASGYVLDSTSGDCVCAAAGYVSRGGTCDCAAEGYALTDGICKCSNSAGYVFKSEACQQKQCSCPHGVPAVGTDCGTDGDDKCSSCTSTGYDLNVNGVCECNAPGYVWDEEEKTCQCADAGYVLQAGICKCAVAGFIVDQDTGICRQKQCKCTNGGEGAVGEACDEDGAKSCGSCYEGFSSTWDNCKKRQFCLSNWVTWIDTCR